MRTWFVLLFGRILRIRCFNLFNVCTLRSEMIVARLVKNSPNVIPSLCQKTLAVTWPVCSPSSSVQFRFTTLWRPSILPPEGCWRRRSETQRARRASTLQKKVLVTDIQRVTQRWKNCGDNGGEFVKNNISFVKNVPVTYWTCVIIVVAVSEKQ